MSLASKLKNVKVKPKRTTPVWHGPIEDGVTQSLIGRYLCCKERFRLLVVEGLKPADAFEPRIEYGNMWHVCEEALAEIGASAIPGSPGWVLTNSNWEDSLREYVKSLCRKYPFQQEAISHWYSMCQAQFPLYVEYWSRQKDVTERTPLLQEQTFDVPYTLPSGRTVRLRGKWDAVDLIGKGKSAGVYLQENKTKSQVDPQKIGRQMTFDLQTMLYLVALDVGRETTPDDPGNKLFPSNHPIRGVRYNVIRRSAHKSVESMLKKIEDDRKADRMSEWFARWKVEVSPADVLRFRRECLDPILENLADDYELWAWCTKFNWSPFWSEERPKQFPHHYPRHHRMPYGIYSPVLEGGFSDVDAYMETGSTAGLVHVDNLFPELT